MKLNYLSVWLSVCPWVCLSVCLFVCQSVNATSWKIFQCVRIILSDHWASKWSSIVSVITEECCFYFSISHLDFFLLPYLYLWCLHNNLSCSPQLLLPLLLDPPLLFKEILHRISVLPPDGGCWSKSMGHRILKKSNVVNFLYNVKRNMDFNVDTHSISYEVMDYFILLRQDLSWYLDLNPFFYPRCRSYLKKFAKNVDNHLKEAHIPTRTLTQAQTDRLEDMQHRQTDRLTLTETGRLRNTDRLTDRQTEIDRLSDRRAETNGLTNRQTDRQTEAVTDRPTDQPANRSS